MAQTKFSAGQRVSATRIGPVGAPNGVFRVVSVMPREGAHQQYRVRSEGENFDRIMDEARLEAVSLE